MGRRTTLAPWVSFFYGRGASALRLFVFMTDCYISLTGNQRKKTKNTTYIKLGGYRIDDL